MYVSIWIGKGMNRLKEERLSGVLSYESPHIADRPRFIVRKSETLSDLVFKLEAKNLILNWRNAQIIEIKGKAS